jgi:hypothetical protein
MLALAPRKFILPQEALMQIHYQTVTAMRIRREAKVEAAETQIRRAIPLMKQAMLILLTMSKVFMAPLPQFLLVAISGIFEEISIPSVLLPKLCH